MPAVVCDSSTIIHLSRINRITFLRDFHGKIVVAPAVWNELEISGVIGILTRAKLTGKVPSLRVELDRLKEDAGFWIGDDLYHLVLKAVGEE